MFPIPATRRRILLALIAVQVLVHGCMAGTRLAVPLAALREGRSPLWVGVLVGLFSAAPILVSLAAGNLADRRGYHHPARIGIGLACVGAVLAVLATFLPAASIALYAGAGLLCGSGANIALIAMQRETGRLADDATGLKQVFSWMGIAPAFANVVGPVLAGIAIDVAGFGAAFAVMALLALAAAPLLRRVPRERRAVPVQRRRAMAALGLLRARGFPRLLLVNWLFSSTWEVHAFLVPILGHERNLSASAIGLVLGIFAAAVTAVRFVVPAVAHHLREAHVLFVSMLGCAAVFAVYPFAHAAWQMGVLAALLGVALGAVQPMILTTLHQITPPDRHGEAIALRTLAINVSSTLVPLAFGAVGAAFGTGAVFWAMAGGLVSGSVAARRVAAGD
jgi:MFS family permease